MGGGVARHPLHRHGRVDEPLDPLVLLTAVPQRLGELEGVVQGDLGVEGDLLSDGVHLSVREAQRPAHVPDGRPGLQGTEGDDLAYPVRAIFLRHVVDHVLAAADAEVGVDIGHGHPLGVQEPLEHQVILHGVHVGDFQAVAHDASRRRAAARPHGDAVFLGVADEVGDDEEVVHKPHLADDPHLVAQPLPVLRQHLLVPPLQPRLTDVLKVVPAVGIPLRQLELRQVVLAELKVHLAHLRDLCRVLQRLGKIGKEGRHLFLTLEVEFLRFKLHAVGVVHRLAHLHAHEHVLGPGVRPGEIVGVVGDHQGQAGLLVQTDEPRRHLLLHRDAVVLKFQIVMLRAKQLGHLQSVGLGPLIVLRHQPPGKLPRQTGGQGDKPLAVLPKQIRVDARLVVKPLGVAHGDHVGEVFVPLHILAQQHQMARLVVQPVLPVKPGPGSHIHLTADDRMDPRRLTGLVEVDGAVHIAVVGDGDGALPQLMKPRRQLVDAAHPVQQRVLCMYM